MTREPEVSIQRTQTNKKNRPLPICNGISAVCPKRKQTPKPPLGDHVERSERAAGLCPLASTTPALPATNVIAPNRGAHINARPLGTKRENCPDFVESKRREPARSQELLSHACRGHGRCGRSLHTACSASGGIHAARGFGFRDDGVSGRRRRRRRADSCLRALWVVREENACEALRGFAGP